MSQSVPPRSLPADRAASSWRWLALLVWLRLAASPLDGGAEEVWSASPYRVTVWVALEAVPELDVWKTRLPQVLRQQALATFGAGWQLTVAAAPRPWAHPLSQDLDWPSMAWLESEQPALLEQDKLLIMAAARREGGVLVQVRELDVATQSWGTTLRRLVVRPPRLGVSAAELLLRSFSPLGVIGRAQEDTVEVTMRAGLLQGGAAAGALVPQSPAVFRAVLRKTDRLGRLAPDGLQPIPWTLLPVATTERDVATCDVISGLRNPFRARSTRSVQRLALLVRPEHEATDLRLASLSQPAKGLAGYDIHYRLPGDKQSTLLGRTDWNGWIRVPRDADPVKIIYVKNGARVVVRLPLVPGAEPSVVAELVDDSARLEAEGFLTGVQEEMIELLARRQLFAVRIRQALQQKEWTKAEQLLDQLRGLATRDDLERRMREKRPALTSDNRAVQDRIDRLFRATSSTLQKYLGTASEADQLEQELRAARGAQI